MLDSFDFFRLGDPMLRNWPICGLSN